MNGRIRELETAIEAKKDHPQIAYILSSVDLGISVDKNVEHFDGSSDEKTVRLWTIAESVLAEVTHLQLIRVEEIIEAAINYLNSVKDEESV